MFIHKFIEAIKHGSLEVVKTLIKNGININLNQNKYMGYFTPLSYSIKYKNINISEWLIDFRAVEYSLQEKDNCSMFVAFKNDFLQGVKLLMKRFAYKGGLLKRFSDDSVSLLQIAAQHDSFECAKFLLEHGIEVNDIQSTKYMLPLHLACKNGNLRMAKLLLDHGANINFFSSGFLPVHVASENGHANILNLLFEYGTDSNSLSTQNKAPLDYAIMGRHLNCVKVLMNHKNVFSTNEKKKLLALAQLQGNQEICDFIDSQPII